MSDPVNSPAHYKAGRIEVIEFIRDQDFGYLAGNVVKYVARHRHKGRPLEDLKKARWYLNRLIDELEKEAGVMDEGQEKAIEALAKDAEANAQTVAECLKKGTDLCKKTRDGSHVWGTPQKMLGVERPVAFCTLCYDAACYQADRS